MSIRSISEFYNNEPLPSNKPCNQWCLCVSEWKSLSHVWLFVTPWTVESTEFPRPKYWPFPSPWDLLSTGIEPRSPAFQADSLPAESQGKPKITGMGSLSLSRGSSWPRNRTGVFCIARGFFINSAIREAQMLIWTVPVNFFFLIFILCWG